MALALPPKTVRHPCGTGCGIHAARTSNGGGRTHMMQRKHLILVPGLLAAAVVAVACRDSATPARSVAPRPDFWAVSAACFRMTGGGRIDKPGANMGGAESPTGKNTPTSRDFATFGFKRDQPRVTRRVAAATSPG